MRRYIVGVAVFGITPAPVRMALNTIIVVLRPPNPTRIVASIAEAESYVKEQLSAAATAARRTA